MTAKLAERAIVADASDAALFDDKGVVDPFIVL
ncbi:hypothetical protein ABH935_001031 [Catenulispora sp. GAS73]